MKPPVKNNLTNNLNHYQWLDFIRFIAALLVVMSHTRNFLYQDYANIDEQSRNIFTVIFFAISRLGHESVIIFFVLSGYLVGGKAIQRITKNSFNHNSFAIDRISRIWTPLIPALILSGLVSGFSDNINTWLGNFLGLQGILVTPLGKNGPLWSLAYEIWFYVLAYAIGKQATNKKLDFTSLFIFILVTLIFLKLEIQYLLCWIIGAIFYVKPHNLSLAKSFLIGIPLSAIAVSGLQLTGDGYMNILNQSSILKPGFEILLAVSGGIFCVTLKSVGQNSISNSAARLSAFSYTLYLTHYPLLIIITSNDFQRFSQVNLFTYTIYLSTIIICLIAAWILYLPFEKNTDKIRALIKSKFLS